MPFMRVRTQLQFALCTSIAMFAGLLTAPVSPCAAAASPATQPAADWASFKQTVEPSLPKHCFECHDETEKGDVRLDLFSDENTLIKNLGTIEQAQSMLRKHAMPPKKKAQPSEEEVRPVLAWFSAFIERMDRELPTNPGRVVVRRLNRAEYNNTVRDLLGVNFRPADDFPPDDSGYGFDNIGAALSMSPTLMEKYLAAAEKVARTAMFGVAPMKPEKTSHEPFFTSDAFSKNKTVKFDYDETGMSLPSALHVTQQFAASGQYKFRAILRGTRPPGSNPAEIGFWIDGKLVYQATITPPRSGEMNGQWAEFETPVAAGEHWLSVTLLHMYDGLPQVYNGPHPSSAKGTLRIGSDAWFPMYLDVVGPYDQVMGPTKESLKKIYTCGSVEGPHDPSCARLILANLARRAYRRPVTDK